MKKLIFIFLNIIMISAVNAQKGINFSHFYSGGGKLLLCVDSSAKHVYYNNTFPNQPNTSFSYLPDVNNISIQIFFRKNINVKDYRYTILIDDKPIMVNQTIKIDKLIDAKEFGDDEIFSKTTLGTFPIKEKIITVLGYSLDKPLIIDKSVFYGKPIPKAQIKSFTKLTAVGGRSSYTWITYPKERSNLVFAKNDFELSIVKNKSDIDYLYSTSIKDKLTNKIIYESTFWNYGGLVDNHEFLPYVKVDRSVFKKSGDYEIIIQPNIKWSNHKPKDLEKYITRHTISVTIDEKLFSAKELVFICLIIGIFFGIFTVVILNYRKIKNAKKIFEAQQKKQTAQLQLNSVRSQLNPHFLFNALAGIQNLMNKNEIDNANKYLTKFARLTRNVLDSKELISLVEEKALLDDYLQMEQLRFGFQYVITAPNDLDIENIEIPAMLLQPFVENAVKHGIAEKGTDGKIEIEFEKSVSDLILNIKDNGNGFDSNNTYNGLGLALSKNRISLLNTIYKETPFGLNIQANDDGTTITITLTQWL